MELGTLHNIKLATKQDKDDNTVFVIVLEVTPKSSETIELVRHIAKGETLVVTANVLQPEMFGSKSTKGGDQ